jgi:hypothetical protein
MLGCRSGARPDDSSEDPCRSFVAPDTRTGGQGRPVTRASTSVYQEGRDGPEEVAGGMGSRPRDYRIVLDRKGKVARRKGIEPPTF